mmetsp:Transcript_65321/g.103496  ORF Transcript_65321/g.103496 Transcript_65321/m.103496 type:complete len:245 (-) Transcript_65321:59-793(-)
MAKVPALRDSCAEDLEHVCERPSPRNFCDVQIMQKLRGLSSLGRGWQTPDPSPRVSSELPRCAAKDFIVNYGAYETASTRTPSPSSSKDCEMRPSPCRFRTPSPHRDYYGAGMFPTLPTMSFSLPWNREDFGDGRIEEPIAMRDPCFTPPETFAPRMSWASISDVASSDAEERADVEGIAWPSSGSIGHPNTCAQACKYFRKARGCKDADRCDRCHLCIWKQPSAGKQGEAREQRGRTARVYRR